MTKTFPEQRGPNVADDSLYASDSGLSTADQALLENAAAEANRDPEDRQPASLSDDDALYMDVATQPMSEITAERDVSGDGETADGLDDMEEAVRQQAEDRVTGDHKDFIA